SSSSRFRSARSGATTISSASSRALAARKSTETPTSRPPASWTPSATTFIRPTSELPHTRVCPPLPSSRANSRGGCVSRSSRSAAERKTQMFTAPRYGPALPVRSGAPGREETGGRRALYPARAGHPAGGVASSGRADRDRRTSHQHRGERPAGARGARRPGTGPHGPGPGAAGDGLSPALLHPAGGRAAGPADALRDDHPLPLQGHRVVLVGAGRGGPGVGVPGPEARGRADQGPPVLLRGRRELTPGGGGGRGVTPIRGDRWTRR